MNEHQGQTPAAIAQQVAGQVSDYLRSEIRDVASSIATERDALVNAIRSEAQATTGRYASQVEELSTQAIARFEESSQKVSDDVARRFAEGVKVVSDRGVQEVTEAASRAGELIGTGMADLRAVTEEVRAAAAEARELTEAARTAAAEAREAVATAERAKAEAEAATVKSQEEREKAEKATALLMLQGDVEIERMTQTTAFQNRERATLQALKNERAELEDGFDRKAEAIQRGVQQYYPKLQEELDRIVSESENTEKGSDQ